MDEQKVKRINELYRKSKAEGLTDAEKKEQKILRQEYIDAFKRNLRSQLNNIDVEEKDGTIVNLGEKFGNKAHSAPCRPPGRPERIHHVQEEVYGFQKRV